MIIQGWTPEQEREWQDYAYARTREDGDEDGGREPRRPSPRLVGPEGLALKEEEGEKR